MSWSWLRAAPLNTKAPTVRGNLRVPQVLTISTGTWSGSQIKFKYQWFRCTSRPTVSLPTTPATCGAIYGAKAKTYRLTEFDVNKYIVGRVQAGNRNGVRFKFSVGTTSRIVAEHITPINTVAPTIAGSPFVSHFLSVNNGSWSESPSDFTYQWYRCMTRQTVAYNSASSGCAAIVGATSDMYQLLEPDRARYIVVSVRATNAYGSTIKLSKSTSVIAVPVLSPPNAYRASFVSTTENNGRPLIGSMLVADKGEWRGYPVPAIGYANWYRCTDVQTTPASTVPAGCTEITGSGGEAYLVTPDDNGYYLMSEVIASNSSGTARLFSPSTKQISTAPQVHVAPIISGTVGYGNLLTVSTGQWTSYPATVTFQYQWYRCDYANPTVLADVLVGCDEIIGAVESSYTQGAADLGRNVVARVRASNVNFESASTVAAGIGIVHSIPRNTVGPTVSGFAVKNALLTLNQGKWVAHPFAAKSISWLRCTAAVSAAVSSVPAGCAPISGANSTTYLLSDADLSSYVTAAIKQTNSLGSSQVIAESVGPVGLLPVFATRPSISGVATRNSTIQVFRGQWSGNVIFSLNWYACANPQVVSASAPPVGCESWTPPNGIEEGLFSVNHEVVGKYLVVGVTATNSEGSVTAFSEMTTVVTSDPYQQGNFRASGDAIVGASVEADGGVFVSYPHAESTYQWFRCRDQVVTAASALPANCAAIEGATGRTYMLQPADVSRFVAPRITQTNLYGTSVLLGASTTQINGAPYFFTEGTISGAAVVGKLLTTTGYASIATPAVLSEEVDWIRCGEPTIFSADALPAGCRQIVKLSKLAPYQLTDGDIASYIYAVNIATNANGITKVVSSPSAQVLKAPSTNSGTKRTISGELALGATLKGLDGVWSEFPQATVTYTWERCGSVHIPTGAPQGCLVIEGATSSEYALTTEDLDKFIVFRVKHSNPAGAETAYGVTARFEMKPVINADPVISGDPVLDGILSVTSAWAGAPTPTVTYDWYSCPTLISAASALLGLGCEPYVDYAFRTVAAGRGFACAILISGQVGCSGSQYSNGIREVSQFARATSISSWGDTCATGVGMQVTCWGTVHGMAVLKSYGSGVQVSVSESHKCKVVSAGIIQCWGSNSWGKLGFTPTGGATSTEVPGSVSGVSGATQVSAGYNSTCAITVLGKALCWGNGYGQTPKEIPGISEATDISNYGAHACAVVENGRIKCWGDNSFGQLGNGSTERSVTPTYVEGISTAVSVEAGHRFTCALLATTTTYCWGDNNYKQLGNLTATTSSIPVEVYPDYAHSGSTKSISVVDSMACATSINHDIFCWGANGGVEIGSTRFFSDSVSVQPAVAGRYIVVRSSASNLHGSAARYSASIFAVPASQ